MNLELVCNIISSRMQNIFVQVVEILGLNYDEVVAYTYICFLRKNDILVCIHCIYQRHAAMI